MANHNCRLWRYLRSASLIAPTLLAACCPSSLYRGDGGIASESCWPFIHYNVEFASVSTGTAQSRKYSIHRVPDFDVNPYAGVSLTTPRPLYCERFKRSSAMKAVVALRLTSASGQDIAKYRAALSEWDWEHGVPPNPPRPWEPEKCLLSSRSLNLNPQNLHDLTLQITIEQPGESPIELTPYVKSSIMYFP